MFVYFFLLLAVIAYYFCLLMIEHLQIIACPFFEAQAKWIAQLLSGKQTLPPFNEMMKSIKEFYHSRDAAGIPKHYTHEIANFEVQINFYTCFFLKDIAWKCSNYKYIPFLFFFGQYCDTYADKAGLSHLEEWKKELCISAIIKSFINLETFRDVWDENDDKLLQQAFASPHFTQLGPLDFTLHAYGFTEDHIR